jgi:DNA primase
MTTLYGIEVDWKSRQPRVEFVRVEKETERYYCVARATAVSWLRYRTRIEKAQACLSPEDAWARYIQKCRTAVDVAKKAWQEAVMELARAEAALERAT